MVAKFKTRLYTIWTLCAKLKNIETIRCDPIKTPIPGNGAILLKAVFSGSQAKTWVSIFYRLHRDQCYWTAVQQFKCSWVWIKMVLKCKCGKVKLLTEKEYILWKEETIKYCIYFTSHKHTPIDHIYSTYNTPQYHPASLTIVSISGTLTTVLISSSLSRTTRNTEDIKLRHS